MTIESSGDASDRDLIRSAQKGDLDAYGSIVTRYQVAVRAFAAVRIPVKDEAQDIAQDTFVVAWRKLGEFDPNTPIGPWLRTIAQRLVLNHRRKHRAESIGGNDQIEELLQSLPPETVPERLKALRQCLKEIGNPARAILEERYLDGVSVREMAEKTGRGYSALTMQLFRLREMLAACVREKMAVEGGRQ